MAVEGGREKGWVVTASEESKRAVNTIRGLVEVDFKSVLDQRDKSTELINLSIGDPAVFGNLPAHQEGLASPVWVCKG